MKRLSKIMCWCGWLGIQLMALYESYSHGLKEGLAFTCVFLIANGAIMGIMKKEL